MGPKTVSAQAADVKENALADLKKIRDNMDASIALKVTQNPLVTWSNKNVRDLLTDLVKLNDALKAVNAGNDVIPIRGDDDQKKFQSLNDWLGRDKDKAWDRTVVQSLEAKVILLSSPKEDIDVQADGVMGVVSGPEAAPAREAPVKPAAPQPIMADTLRSGNQKLLDDLGYIAENGRKKSVRDEAKNKLKELEKQIRKVNAKKVATLATKDQTFVDRELQLSTNAASDKARQAVVSAAGPHPFDERMTALKASLSTNTTEEGEAARRLLPNAWLLGYHAMDEMITSLEGAASSSDAATAQKYVDAARKVFEDQQKRYRGVLDSVIIPVATAYSNLEAASLPNRYARDIKKLGKNRLDEATKLQKAKYVPFNTVYNLYVAVINESTAVQKLVSLQGYAKAKGSADKASSEQLTDQYTEAVKTSFVSNMATDDPLKSWSKDAREAEVRIYLGLAPEEPLDKARQAEAEKEISALLRTSKPYRYDDSLLRVYEAVLPLVPVSSDPVVASLSKLRSIRAVYSFYLYSPYLDKEGAQVEDQKRFGVAKDFLTRTIKAAEDAGLNSNAALKAGDKSQVLEKAKALLASANTVPSAENIPSASDNLYYAALCLASLAENYVWATTDSLQRADLGKEQSLSRQDALARVKADLKNAEQAYLWSFSDARLDAPYHAAIPHQLADTGAVSLIAPRAFAVTEAPAMYAVLEAYVNPSAFDTNLVGPFTADQRFDTIAAIEAKHLAILETSEPDKALFPRSAADASIANAKVKGLFDTLNWAVGEVQLTLEDYSTTPPKKVLKNYQVDDPRFADFKFPDMEQTIVRGTPTFSLVDRHIVPDTNGLAADGTTVADPVAVNFGSLTHEDIGLRGWGGIYVEMTKQLVMAFDDSAPVLLRDFRTPPASLVIRGGTPFEAQDRLLRSRTESTVRTFIQSAGGAKSLLGIETQDELAKYVSTTPPMVVLNTVMRKVQLNPATDQAQQARLNSILMAVLDLRIAELETRLGGAVQLDNGKIVAVASLEDSKNPKHYYVTRAREMLDAVKTYRQGVVGGANLFVGTNPRLAIAVAENGIESLSDEHLSGITEAVVTQPATFTPFAEMTGETATLENKMFYQAKVTKVNVKVEEKEMSLGKYEKANGPQKLHYLWAFYVKSGKDYLVLNPNFGWPGHETEPEYVGRVMRNIRLPDGTTGDAVVAADRPGTATGADMSITMEWEPRRVGGRYDVLFILKKGTLEPSRILPAAAAAIKDSGESTSVMVHTKASSIQPMVQAVQK
ncbi:MAG: hypothetical protein PHF60_01575 [Candidatus ainarchaeum sp.]|nr:hypothetical protein [Candidatus ainarchaeum sp.]